MDALEILEQPEIDLIEKLGLKFQAKIKLAEQDGFKMMSFDAICNKMGFPITRYAFSPYLLKKGSDKGSLKKISRKLKFGDYIFASPNSRNTNLDVCNFTLIYMGKITDYALSLKQNVLDAIDQNNNGIFDELRIIAPFSHFSQYEDSAKDPTLVGIIYNDDKAQRVLFPILKWE